MGASVKVDGCALYAEPSGSIEMEASREGVFIYTHNGEKGNKEIAVGVTIEGWKAIQVGKLLIALGQMAEGR